MLRRSFVASLLPLGLAACERAALGTGEATPARAALAQPAPSGTPEAASLRARSLEAMRRATRYVTETLAYRGGYVWAYLPDLSRSWGELEARRSMLWVQPPGTPSMGHLFLDAYQATGEELYLRAAEAAADALMQAQTASGGWNYVYDFEGEARLLEWYASIGKNAWRLEEFHRYYANSTFDDACTATATQFLLRLWLMRPRAELERALARAVELVRRSQYPSGGWPQRYPLEQDYTARLTFNDDVLGENVRTLVMLHLALPGAGALAHIQRAMGSVLALQQASPQAGWGLQHDLEGKPAAARSFEPSALVTHTSAANVGRLLDFYELTADERYLSRVPEALAWLKSCAFPPDLAEELGGTHPTFIELGTGDPLYVHRRGSNVVNGHYYTNKVFPPPLAHYVPVRKLDLAALQARFEGLRARAKSELVARSPLALKDRAGRAPLPPFFSSRKLELGDLELGAAPALLGASEARVVTLLDSLDAAGRWLSPLPLVSNPYSGPGGAEPYLADTYASTRVGDRSDTSPYDPSDPPETYPAQAAPLGVSLRTFIDNMAALLSYVVATAHPRSPAAK